MGPSFAETATSRGRFAWLIGTLCASALAMAALLPITPEPPAPTHEQFKHYKRVGKCINGRWVIAHQPGAQ